ncbi:hypothetical protein N42HA_00433 [Lactococcus lactis]|nr:hypothetical protein [Lactococcus lactis]
MENLFTMPTGKVGLALKREYAEVGAKALAGADFPEVLELSGKRLITPNCSRHKAVLIRNW